MIKHQKLLFRFLDSMLALSICVVQLTVIFMIFWAIYNQFFGDNSMVRMNKNIFELGLLAIGIFLFNSFTIFVTKAALTIDFKDSN